jgi:hypothetical protein
MQRSNSWTNPSSQNSNAAHSWYILISVKLSLCSWRSNYIYRRGTDHQRYYLCDSVTELLMSNRLITQCLENLCCTSLNVDYKKPPPRNCWTAVTCGSVSRPRTDLLLYSYLTDSHCWLRRLACVCVYMCMCGGGGGGCMQNDRKHVRCLVYITLKLCDCF